MPFGDHSSQLPRQSNARSSIQRSNPPTSSTTISTRAGQTRPESDCLVGTKIDVVTRRMTQLREERAATIVSGTCQSIGYCVSVSRRNDVFTGCISARPTGRPDEPIAKASSPEKTGTKRSAETVVAADAVDRLKHRRGRRPRVGLVRCVCSVDDGSICNRQWLSVATAKDWRDATKECYSEEPTTHRESLSRPKDGMRRATLGFSATIARKATRP
jgi:hypothetical protein